MKIIVTGGTGYIGSHTVVELQEEGFEVVIIDNLSNSERWILGAMEDITGKKAIFEEFDLTDDKKTTDCLKRHKEASGVIHFAALKAVGESVKFPLHYYRNNILSTINLLHGMKENNITNLVFSSSCTVYGQPENLPVKETSPLKNAESPYGNTKKIAEDIIKDTVKTSEISAISLRYFNPIGAHASARIGELPLGVPENLVPYITQTATGKRDFLRVFGNDYNTKDGTPVRDYIHITDLAEAHIVALKRLIEGTNKEPCEIFNLGTGRGYTVMEVIRSFEKVSGKKLNYKITDRRKGDIEKIWADTSLANRELKWQARRGLDEMMLSAWNWEKTLSEMSKKQTG